MKLSKQQQKEASARRAQKKAKIRVIRTKEAFLEAYKELCQKHKVYITSCGCCGSPWLSTIEPENGLIKQQVKRQIDHLRKIDNELT